MLLLQSSWQYLVHPRTVTLHSYQSPGVYIDQTVDACDRSAVDERHLSDGQYVVPADECYWHLWAENLDGTVPKAPDVIEDAAGGERWVVIGEVGRMGHGTRFKCRARLEVG